MNTMKLIPIGAYEVVENDPVTSATKPPTYVSDSPSDPTTDQIMRIVEVSGTLDFWDRPEEDLYSVDDGEPI